MMTLTKKEIEAMLKKMEEIGATKIDICVDIPFEYAGYIDGYYINYYNEEGFLEDEEYREN